MIPIGIIFIDLMAQSDDYPDRDNTWHVAVMNAIFSRSGQNQPIPPDVEAVALAIRAARRRHGLTQTQLAGLSGTGLRFISELERGKPNVALNKVLAVLAVLGLRIQISGSET